MTVGGDLEIGVLVGERAPQRSLGSMQTPAGLIHVQMPACAHRVKQILVGFGEGARDPGEHPSNGASRQTRLEELFAELDRVTTRDTVADRERRDRGLQPGPKMARSDLSGAAGPCAWLRIRGNAHAGSDARSP